MSRSAAITLGALEADEDGDGAASFPTSLEGRPSDVSEQAQSVSLAGEQGASASAADPDGNLRGDTDFQPALDADPPPGEPPAGAGGSAGDASLSRHATGGTTDNSGFLADTGTDSTPAAGGGGGESQAAAPVDVERGFGGLAADMAAWVDEEDESWATSGAPERVGGAEERTPHAGFDLQVGMQPEPEPEPEPDPGPQTQPDPQAAGTFELEQQSVSNPLALGTDDVEAPPVDDMVPPPPDMPPPDMPPTDMPPPDMPPPPPTDALPPPHTESPRRRESPARRRASARGGQQVVQVTVPDGAYPGCRLEVQLPDGSTLSVMVPEGAEAGSVVQATIPTAGQAPPGAPASTQPAPPQQPVDGDEQGSEPPPPSDLIDWEVFSQRRQHLGVGLSVIGAVLLCLSVLHFMEHEQLLKENAPADSVGCTGDPCITDDQRSRQASPAVITGETNPSCDPRCVEFNHYKQSKEVQELKGDGDTMFEWGVVLCMLAAPLVLGMREFTKALIGSCCCCCIDMSTFLTQSETCSMLFIRILVMDWVVVFFTKDGDAGYWQFCVFAGAMLHLLFSCAAVVMSRSNHARAPARPAPSSTQTDAPAAASAQADDDVQDQAVAPPAVTRTAPSLLRCGKCAEIFGLPPGTPADAAARCPHCSTVNRQPPTFSEKHARLQARLCHLRAALQRQRRSRHGTKLRLRITRENVLGDSFSHLRGVDGSLVASLPLSVQFDGEEGLDQGGVTREWMFLLMQAVLDPQVALFSTSNENYVYQINSSSHINPEHLDYFNFLGKLLAKCVCDGITTPFSHFTPDVYNVLLQRPTYFSDLQVIDSDIYRSLQWILDNSVEDLGLTFVVDEDDFGMIRQVDLKEGGKDIKVTEENKKEFVELKAKYTMVDRKMEQLTSVRGLPTLALAGSCSGVERSNRLSLELATVPRTLVSLWKGLSLVCAASRVMTMVALLCSFCVLPNLIAHVV